MSGEELTHLIAMTRQVIACHAQVFEELRYWGNGVLRGEGGVVHVVEENERGEMDRADRALFNPNMVPRTLNAVVIIIYLFIIHSAR